MTSLGQPLKPESAPSPIDEHLAPWKQHVSLAIPKQLYLAHVTDRAFLRMGCCNGHKLIASCLDFLDSQA